MNDKAKKFRTLGEAALYCKKEKCPYTWVSGSDARGYTVSRPKNGAAKKKKPTKSAKRKPTKRKATKRKATKKRAPKKKSKKPGNPDGGWGRSIEGDTPKPKFFRAQKRRGRSKPQAQASWNLKRGAGKKRGSKKKR